MLLTGGDCVVRQADERLGGDPVALVGHLFEPLDELGIVPQPTPELVASTV